MLTDTHTRTLCTLCLISDCEECRSATRLTTVAAIGRWEGMSQAADWREGPGPCYALLTWELKSPQKRLLLPESMADQVLWIPSESLHAMASHWIYGPLGYRAPAFSFALTKVDLWMVLVLVSRLLSWVISPTMTPRLAPGFSLIKCQ